MCARLLWAAAVSTGLVAAALAVPSARADVVVYQNDPNLVLFEAEWAVILDRSINGALTVTADPAASGGQALVAAADGQPADLTMPGSVAVWRVRFTSPGDYYLYLRYMAPSSSSDSFFGPPDFWLEPNDYNYRQLLDPDSAIDYLWWRVRPTADAQNTSAGQIFSVTIPAGEAFSELQFRIGSRELLTRLDRLMFTKTKFDLSSGVPQGVYLEGMANSPTPEPATLALMAAGMGLMVMLRRRR